MGLSLRFSALLLIAASMAGCATSEQFVNATSASPSADLATVTIIRPSLALGFAVKLYVLEIGQENIPKSKLTKHCNTENARYTKLANTADWRSRDGLVRANYETAEIYAFRGPVGNSTPMPNIAFLSIKGLIIVERDLNLVLKTVARPYWMEFEDYHLKEHPRDNCVQGIEVGTIGPGTSLTWSTKPGDLHLSFFQEGKLGPYSVARSYTQRIEAGQKYRFEIKFTSPREIRLAPQM